MFVGMRTEYFMSRKLVQCRHIDLTIKIPFQVIIKELIDALTIHVI